MLMRSKWRSSSKADANWGAFGLPPKGGPESPRIATWIPAGTARNPGKPPTSPPPAPGDRRPLCKVGYSILKNGELLLELVREDGAQVLGDYVIRCKVDWRSTGVLYGLDPAQEMTVGRCTVTTG